MSRLPIKVCMLLFVIARIASPKCGMVYSFSSRYRSSRATSAATSSSSSSSSSSAAAAIRWKIPSRRILGVGAGERIDDIGHRTADASIRNRVEEKKNHLHPSSSSSSSSSDTPTTTSAASTHNPAPLRRTTVSSGFVTRRIATAIIMGGSTAITAEPSPSVASPSASPSPSSSPDRGPGTTDNDGLVVDLPLEFIPTLGAYVVRYSLFGEAFSAIVDTGSPFLTVPCYCKPYRNQKMFWGCYRPELTYDSGYGNTIEGFDNNYGTVVWRKAGFSFSQGTADDAVIAPFNTDVVFGVLDRDLLNGSGGVFFGLIKETDRWIRPSFLGQTGYKSFCVDLRHTGTTNTINGTDTTKDANQRFPKSLGSGPRLILSKESMIGTGNRDGSPHLSRGGERSIAPEESEDWIPLTRDLKKKYGAPVVHYTARASRFVVNGMSLLINRKKPLYVIFDTGVSGMVVSQELFDGRYLQARKNREKSLWGTVEVSFLTDSGREVTLSAKKPLTTPLGKATPWKGFRGNLIAVGLAFLDGLATTVDVDDGRILFVSKQE